MLWRVRFLLVFRMPMLEFHHGGTPYQFGFNPWAKIAKALPFEFEERMTSMAWSWWSVGYRLVILAIGAVLIGLELAR